LRPGRFVVRRFPFARIWIEIGQSHDVDLIGEVPSQKRFDSLLEVLPGNRRAIKGQCEFTFEEMVAATQALGDGSGNYITSASVRGRMTTGTPVTYLPFTQTNVVGPAAGSLLLYAQAVTLLNPVGSRDDNLDLRIDLTALTIPAGTYTGVLTIQARSI